MLDFSDHTRTGISILTSATDCYLQCLIKNVIPHVLTERFKVSDTHKPRVNVSEPEETHSSPGKGWMPEFQGRSGSRLASPILMLIKNVDTGVLRLRNVWSGYWLLYSHSTFPELVWAAIVLRKIPQNMLLIPTSLRGIMT